MILIIKFKCENRQQQKKKSSAKKLFIKTTKNPWSIYDNEQIYKNN